MPEIEGMDEVERKAEALKKLRTAAGALRKAGKPPYLFLPKIGTFALFNRTDGFEVQTLKAILKPSSDVEAAAHEPFVKLTPELVELLKVIFA